MPRSDKSRLPEYRAQAQEAIRLRAHTALPSGEPATPAQIALGEAIWVALRLNGFEPMAGLKRPGFKLHLITYCPEGDYPGARRVDVSYFHPSDNSRVEGKHLGSIVTCLQTVLLPVLGRDGIARYVTLRRSPWVPDPKPISSIEIVCPPDSAIRKLRERVLK